MDTREFVDPVSDEDSIVITDEEKIKEARSTLNEGQTKAFDGLYNFLTSDKKYTVLIGYAGTGKTYMVSKLLSVCKGKKAATAPTNKAVKVLRENGDLGNVTYTTIHQLLALKLKWQYPASGTDGEPEQILVPKFREGPTIHQYDILILDEVSMLDDKLFEMLESHAGNKIKIIFLGDPAQIPPVTKNGGNPDAIPLLEKEREKYDIQMFELTEIMRQKGDSKIISTAYDIRTNRFKPTDTIKDRTSGKDVLFYSSNYQEDKIEFVATMLDMFSSEEFKNDPNYCKLLAWTNRTVDGFNNLIRKRIFNTTELLSIMKGEKLIADKPIIDTHKEYDEWSGKNKPVVDILFNTSDEFEVVDFTEREVTFEKGGKDKRKQKQKQLTLSDDMTIEAEDIYVTLKYYDCIVEYMAYDTDERFQKSIKILQEVSQKTYQYLLNTYKQHKEWNEFTETLEYFARVKYNYGITCHKAQGSTYGNVFLIEDDIDKNFRPLERNRIKYTACTRAKERLFILSHKNRRHTSG